MSNTASAETIHVVIIRVARFAEAPVNGREWVTDALRGVPGIRAAYHAASPEQAGDISVAIADDKQAMEAGTRAIARRRASGWMGSVRTRSPSTWSITSWRTLGGEVHP